MKTTFSNKEVWLCNIYAPNADKNQISFFSTLEQKLQEKNADNLIIRGDFNVALSTDMDRKTSSQRTRTAKRKGEEQLIKTICNLELIDIWRKRNPCKTKYTYRNSIAKPTIQSRLDLLLVSDNIANSVTDCKIIPSIAPDHSAVTITIESTIHAERGPGLWKFNSEVLKECFIQDMRIQIAEGESRFSYICDPRTKWEPVKCEIRSFAINNSIKRSKQRKKKEREN